MTRKGPRFLSSRRFVFSQDFTLPNQGQDISLAGKPEAWGFSGAHWKIYWKTVGHQVRQAASSSIETEFFELPTKAPGETLGYSLQTPAFRRPLTYAPGKSGFIAQFALEFQDGWTHQDAFSLCLEDSRKGEESWCLRVIPRPKKSGKRFSRQVSLKAASGQGATATVKPREDAPKEEDLPEEEDPDGTGWWAFQIQFTPSGDVRVLVRPDTHGKFQSLLSFRNRKEFHFDRLGISSRTAKERRSHHNISLDDFVVIATTP